MKESKPEKSNPWTTSAPPPPRPPSTMGAQVHASTSTAEDVDSRSSPGFPPAATDELSLETAHLVNNAELHAIVGSGTSFQGTLSFAGRVRIDGEFTGQIIGGQVLVIGPGARVSGEIRARQVIAVGGTIDANITAHETIELYLPAEVKGDLRSPQIYMDRGLRFSGTCDMSEGPVSD